MGNVKVHQFGGHIGSFAGDCAVVTIDTPPAREVIIIDTGSSTVWSSATELMAFVQAELSTAAKKKVTLVTTHFHKDHYDLGNLNHLKVDLHIFSRQAAANSGAELPFGNTLALKAGEFDYRGSDTGCLVRFYVPPGGKSEDQNDQSMAVFIDCPEFSFLSFGDMTKDAYLRLVDLVGPLPRASTTKYPHHGNHPANFLAYYDENLFSTAVMISGNSGSDVDKTITRMLEQNVGAVYCLARTREAREQFEQSWRQTGLPIYISDDATLIEGGVWMNGGRFFVKQTTQVTKSRSTTENVWVKVKQDWTDSEMSE